MTTVRADIAELLHAGYGDRTIARQTGVTIGTVTRARAALRLPKARGGVKAAESVEDLFWRRTRPVDGGHLEWTGNRSPKGVPTLNWQHGRYSGYRIAYTIRHGVEPAGYAFTACDHPGCVAPDHVADTATTRRRAHHRRGGGRPATSRDAIVRLIREGCSNSEIGRRLRTDPKRAAAIRAELGLPPVESPRRTFEDRWAEHAEETGDGHVRWTGRHRAGRTPSVLHDGEDRSVRRVVFERLHGRLPVGPVLPGCGADWCVAPDHITDAPMRRADAAYDAIFGAAA